MVMAEFTDWVWKRIEENQDEMPTNAISLDVEDIVVTFYDYVRMVQPEWQGKQLALAKDLNIFTDEEAEMLKGYTDRKINLPAKIMFGDGITWAGIISLPIHKASGAYVYTCNKIQRSIVNLLNSLPVCYGLGIRNDVLTVQDVFTRLSGEEVKMKGFIQLDALAILSGWQFKYKHMTAMSMIMLGSTMNKVVSQGDGKWGLRYRDLPHSLKAYAIADLKFGYMTYNVFLACLMRELFPDPEICCRFSECGQRRYVTWFCSYINQVLDGLCVYELAASTARTSPNGQ